MGKRRLVRKWATSAVRHTPVVLGPAHGGADPGALRASGDTPSAPFVDTVLADHEGGGRGQLDDLRCRARLTPPRRLPQSGRCSMRCSKICWVPPRPGWVPPRAVASDCACSPDAC